MKQHGEQGIRVAFVTPTRARGWRAQPILREFSRLVPQTVVFTGYWPGFTAGFQGKFEVRQLRGVRFYPESRREHGTARGFTLVSPLAFLQLLSYRPQVVFTNGFHLLSLYAAMLRYLVGTRVVLLWQGVSAETGGETGSWRSYLRRGMARFFDLAICNTRRGADYLVNEAGFPAAKIWREVCEVAERGALQHGDAAKVPERAHPTFLFAGSVVRHKGLATLIEACAKLKQRGMSANQFSVVIAGDGSDRPGFEQMARDLGVDDRIHWQGSVPYEELGRYYERADVFVLPSLEDTWGVVVLEAMSFGKPVLCSTAAGVSEMVRPGVNGFLFGSGDASQLAALMSRCIGEPELVSHLGAAAKRTAEEYTPERTARILVRAAEMVCGTVTINTASQTRSEALPVAAGRK